MDSDADGVNDFLQRIRELGDKRDREDEERSRRLEQEIIAGREARRARRDERARSLSPQKDSPQGTPTSIQSFLLDSPRSETTGDVRIPGKREDSENDESAVREQGGRPTGPLSWQRRPKSNTVSSSSSSHRLPSDRQAQQHDSSDEEIEKRRSQIALNLGSKDPSWFRQTADRGTTSGALRKAQEEGMNVTGRMPLPGMSTSSTIGRDVGLGPIKQSLSAQSSNETLKSANFLSSGYLGRSESMRSTDRIPSSISASGLSSHSRDVSLSSSTSLRFDPPGRESLSSTDGINRLIAMSPSQGRISPERRERTPSPTKGLGSFVQSAMLKREGSINKRWSNSQQPGVLSRNNSSAGSGPTARPPFPRARDSTATADDPRESSLAFDDVSRSGIKKESIEGEGGVCGIGRRGSAIEGLSSSYPLTGDGGLDPPSKRSNEDTPPSSPSKTIDQKRWSPTKSSWLESALKKGAESPQFSPPPMKPLVKPFEKPPLRPFEKKLPETASTPVRPPTNPKPPNLSPKPLGNPPDLTSPKADVPSDTGDVTSIRPSVADKPIVCPKPSLKSPINITAPILEKSPLRPREPLNLRAGLKPRPVVGGNGKGEELPFLNAMSRLRSVKTQNYAAPNELKERILAGKANLQATGGPQKNKGPDPVKETLLSVKGSLRHSSSPSVVPTVPPAETKPKTSNLTKQVLPLAKPGPELKESALANRFNPSLATLLQRDPLEMSLGRSLEAAQSEGRSEATSNTEIQGSGKALTHVGYFWGSFLHYFCG
ncbi:unnamed protein product [Tuber melanosporum]|uniref:(Perigord truffle) hypothetical protein n=1 Tax=Tuber melanosporum (strain Mel28) TaxID=656061 RepID=D5GD12_TUBMM|nr:uncharacterized protein GSTUM_00000900001 [Tuber melanosporum]CAZ82405.1 unnamed protein product [Tuber melanosporum]